MNYKTKKENIILIYLPEKGYPIKIYQSLDLYLLADGLRFVLNVRNLLKRHF